MCESLVGQRLWCFFGDGVSEVTVVEDEEENDCVVVNRTGLLDRPHYLVRDLLHTFDDALEVGRKSLQYWQEQVECLEKVKGEQND